MKTMLKFYSRAANTKWFDVAAASPLIIFYAFAIFGIFLNARPDMRILTTHLDGSRVLLFVSQMATMTFLGVQIVVFAVRRLPQAKASGLLPRIAAIIGSNVQILFLLIPRAEHGTTLRIVSLVLLIAGMAASIYVACCLGRSFSVLPQARSLTMSGPYRFVRHPLYLAEQIATLGVMFQFAAPWSLLVAATSFAAQFPRMHYEEGVLETTFPGYREYMNHTARLIPGVY